MGGSRNSLASQPEEFCRHPRGAGALGRGEWGHFKNIAEMPEEPDRERQSGFGRSIKFHGDVFTSANYTHGRRRDKARSAWNCIHCFDHRSIWILERPNVHVLLAIGNLMADLPVHANGHGESFKGSPLFPRYRRIALNPIVQGIGGLYEIVEIVPIEIPHQATEDPFHFFVALLCGCMQHTLVRFHCRSLRSNGAARLLRCELSKSQSSGASFLAVVWQTCFDHLHLARLFF